MSKEAALEASWEERLKHELSAPYWNTLTAFIENEYKSEVVYPRQDALFKAFELCPFNEVKVVILGQDPYHGEGQATGLAFGVEEKMALPPSLRNIYKELESDLGEIANKDGNLSRWAKQGVLLLNATLTVRAASPGSHQKRGWEQFTDAVVDALSSEREHLVFMLWGNYARAKGARIDREKHCVIESAHPSPLSARAGFFGSKPFSTANAYLLQHGKEPVDWLR